MFVGKMSTSSSKALSAASIPRVAPRSLSAASASKNAWSIVVLSAAMKLACPRSAHGQIRAKISYVHRLVGPVRQDELFIRVRNVEGNQICQRFHARRNLAQSCDVPLDTDRQSAQRSVPTDLVQASAHLKVRLEHSRVVSPHDQFFPSGEVRGVDNRRALLAKSRERRVESGDLHAIELRSDVPAGDPDPRPPQCFCVQRTCIVGVPRTCSCRADRALR